MPTLRTGYTSLAAAGYETDLDRGHEYGFDFVELTMNDYDRSLMADEAAAFRRIAAANDLDLVVHLPFGGDDLAVGSGDAATREASVAELQACLRAAGAVDAEKAVLHVESSGDATHLIDDGRLEPLVEAFEALDAVASECGVELCVENMLRRPPRLEDLAALLERTALSLTVDTGHARCNGRDDAETAAFVADHADAVSHFHLNDTRGPEDEHLPFGAGTVDFERILGALPADWTGTLTLEITTPSYDYIEFSRRKLAETIDAVA